MRTLVFGVVLLAVSTPRADACVRAGEANKLVGWSADGTYALYELVTGGKLDHAEILPTTYTGFVYTISQRDDDHIIVSRAKVGSCASWGDDDAKAIVETGRGKLTEDAVLKLATVAAMKFGRVETGMLPPKPPAAFTGKNRYDRHDVQLGSQVLPLPVYCVGSCLADENWTKWSVTVDGTHAVGGGVVLYELSLANVCNGGTIHRVVATPPAGVTVPKQRCFGSGE